MHIRVNVSLSVHEKINVNNSKLVFTLKARLYANFFQKLSKFLFYKQEIKINVSFWTNFNHITANTGTRRHIDFP